MNELLQVFTAFGVMVAGTGDKALTGPLPCEKQIYHRIDPLLLKDEHGKMSEGVSVERRPDGPQSYLFTYTIRHHDGAESSHIYHVHAGRDCRDIQVKKL